MSGLECLSLACNVVQIVSVAHDTLNFCKDVYRGRFPDAALHNNILSLQTISAKIADHHITFRPQTQEEKDLISISRKCNVAARALEEESRFVESRNAKGSLRASLRIALISNWRKARLSGLEKDLNSYQKTLETHLLARICSQNDAIKLQQDRTFGQLDKTLQKFISQSASGNVKLHKLVESTREHTTFEATRIENAIVSHVTTEVSEAKNWIDRSLAGTLSDIAISSTAEAQRVEQGNHLMKSLKFPGMNERLNDLSNRHKGTFEWILDSIKDPAAPETSATVATATQSDDEPDRITTPLSEPQSSIDTRGSLWDDFSDWLRSDDKLYWISGKPGSGKSTLMKFLISEKRTLQALRVWKDDPIVISHFLWKAGSVMQSNIKGLLCSLLHEAFLKQRPVLSAIRSSMTYLETKDCVTDWSVPELQLLLQKVIEIYPSTFCIFLDGLDEVSDEDGVLALIQLVDKLQENPKVKLCVSSRPEPLLQKRLCTHQHLRLQDLTRKDLEHYVTENMKPCLRKHNVEPKLEAHILSRLVEKAEGVFLWLHLATQSLTRGLETGDAESALKERLEELPSELIKLYRAMWLRLNVDTKVHNRCAAWYLNWVLETRNGITRSEFHPDVGMSISGGGVVRCASVFHLMAASNSDAVNTLLDVERQVQVQSLHELCAETLNSILAKCTGFIEIRRRNSAIEPFRSSQNTPLEPYIGSDVIFTHRTVYDFLTDTQDGRDIRQHDTFGATEKKLRVLKSSLALMRIIHIENPMRTIRITLAALAKLWSSIDLTGQHRTLQFCQDWYECDHHAFQQDSQLAPTYRFSSNRTHFFAFAYYIEFQDFKKIAIAKSTNPAELATRVLCDSRIFNLHLLPYLLLMGADPNEERISYGGLWSVPPQNVIPLHNGIGRFVQELFKIFQAGELPEVWLQRLIAILEEKPNLSHQIPLVIGLNRSGTIGRKRVEINSWERRFRNELRAVLAGNVTFYIDMIHRRSSQHRLSDGSKPDWSPLNESLQALLSRADTVRPSANIKYIGRYEEKSQKYEYLRLEDTTSEKLMGFLESWMSGNASETMLDEMFDFAIRLFDNVGENSTLYEGFRHFAELLAKERCGCRFADENENLLPGLSSNRDVSK